MALGPLAVVHPFPSVLNAALVLALAMLAGGSAASAGLAAGAMLALQFTIGALNDVVDAERDVGRIDKPIPAGRISRATAFRVAVGCAVTGLALALTLGPLPFVVAVVGLGCGISYDTVLKRNGSGWLAFAVALPLLVAFAWLAGAGQLPPRWQVLLPIAALAGPTLQLSNALVDRELDAAAGLAGPVARLGPRVTWSLLTVAVVVVYVLAWATLVSPATPWSLAGSLGASILAAAGLWLSRSADRAGREAGWALQAIGMALLGSAWVAAARP